LLAGVLRALCWRWASFAKRFQGIQSLLLFGGKERADLGVQLFHDRIRILPGLFMNRVELRLNFADQRLDLGLLSIGQVQRMSQHSVQVMRTMMMTWHWITRSLTTGEGSGSQGGNDAKS